MKNASKAPFAASLILLALAMAAPRAYAGVYTDDLSKCLVSKTTPAQKSILVNWMFSAMARNPAVARFVSIPESERDAFDEDMAKLFESLLIDTCRSEAQAAVKNEGSQAIGAGFNVLGQVAGRELFANPEVASAMNDLDKYIDMTKIGTVLDSAGPAAR